MKNRTIKELLQLMLDNQKLFSTGLCFWTIKLFSSRLITENEYFLLNDYIKANRPSKYSSIDAYKYRNTNLYWKENNIKPRIKWLNKHIKLNSIN